MNESNIKDIKRAIEALGYAESYFYGLAIAQPVESADRAMYTADTDYFHSIKVELMEVLHCVEASV